MLQCWWRMVHLPSYFIPTLGIWQLKSPHPQEFPIQGQKNANARGSAGGGGGGGGGGLGIAGIELMHNFLKKKNIKLLITFQKQHLAIKIIEKQSTTVLKPSNFGIEKGKPGQKFALSPPWPTIYHFRSFDLPWWQSAPLPNLSRHHT